MVFLVRVLFIDGFWVSSCEAFLDLPESYLCNVGACYRE